MDDSQIVIIGANGQLGRALRLKYPGAVAIDSDQLDISDLAAVNAFNWAKTKIILNAAAYTDVDGAETTEGRVAAWSVNARGIGNLVHPAWRHDMTIVHLSTDYVFDGSHFPHTEDETLSPLSVYGASKAAGDLLAAQMERHYIIRTGWVIGDGKNFVRTMLELGDKGINPTVVADQIGRPTFTSELVRAIDHLLINKAAFGIYNVTNSGEAASWADITREVFKIADVENTVTDTSTAQYFAGKAGIATRPLHSELDLSKIQATGFKPADWKTDLKKYIKEQGR